MSDHRENLLLPAPIDDLIRNSLNKNIPHSKRETYRSRMVLIRDALESAINIFDKQK